MFFIFRVVVGLCIAFVHRLKHSPAPLHCDRSRAGRQAHAVRVFHVAYILPADSPDDLSDAERNNLTFLRHLIKTGHVNEGM